MLAWTNHWVVWCCTYLQLSQLCWGHAWNELTDSPCKQVLFHCNRRNWWPTELVLTDAALSGLVLVLVPVQALVSNLQAAACVCRSIAINYTRIRDVERELRELQMQVRQHTAGSSREQGSAQAGSNTAAHTRQQQHA